VTATRVTRTLVIHPGALGDVLLALPALAHLARLTPGTRRVLAVAPRLAALLDRSAYVEEAIDLDALGLHRLFATATDPTALQSLAGYDAVVSWLGAGDAAYREHLGAMAGRPGRRVVIARAAPPPGSNRHAAWHLLDTLAGLGPPPADLPAVRLTAGAGERDWAAGWLEERGLAPGTVAVLHPGAGSAAKVWPGFPTLARRLAVLGLPVVAVTGPAEAARVAGLAAAAGLPEARVARDLSLRQLAALFERAAVFVGNDSGLSHLAAGVGCASLVLFGPTDPEVWAPLGLRVRVVGGQGPQTADPWQGVDVGRVERAALDLARGSAIGVG
jgi:lipopolysaccharide heptosyltransferase III